MIAGASSSSPPLAVATLTLPGAVSLAVPMTTSTLFFFMRCPMPPESCLATPRERLMTASKSKSGFSTFSPNSAARWKRWKTSDERSSALVGMQPQLRQMPPRCSRSTITTLRPSCAARMAAT